MIRLTYKEAPERIGMFDTYHGDEHLGRYSSVLRDGARALLEHGVDPDQLMTIRAHNRDYDSFKPVRVGAAARVPPEPLSSPYSVEAA